jgi:hypothetical protein
MDAITKAAARQPKNGKVFERGMRGVKCSGIITAKRVLYREEFVA